MRNPSSTSTKKHVRKYGAGLAAAALMGGLLAVTSATPAQAAYPNLVNGHTAFTSSGTWTVPTGVTVVRAQVWGAGGSGGAGFGVGGGGAGAFQQCDIIVLPVVEQLTITVGAGGAATGNWLDGSAGGATTVTATNTTTGVDLGVNINAAPGSGGKGGHRTTTGATVSGGAGGASGQCDGGTVGGVVPPANVVTTAGGNGGNGTFGTTDNINSVGAVGGTGGVPVTGVVPRDSSTAISPVGAAGGRGGDTTSATSGNGLAGGNGYVYLSW